MARGRIAIRTALLSLTIGLLSISIVLAQRDTCPALVEQAMATANTACGVPGRNTACYGNTLVNATGWNETELAFTQPGDKVNLADIATLSTAPLDTESATWGVALLSLQANLPDTVPGQNVYFVIFGGVEIESAAAPPSGENIALPAQVLSATEARRGPSASQESLGTLAAGTTITVNGRNADGDWLQFVQGDITAWIYAPLVQISGDGRTLTALPTVQGVALTAPMQAFRISTGIGTPVCQEAPRDGVLIQAPQDTTVYFNVNGVDVSIGSTAYLHNVTEDILRITNLEGDVDVSSAGVTRELEPGEQVDIVPQSPLPDPEPYDLTNAQSLPLELLPEEVPLPQPAVPAATATPALLACTVNPPAGWVQYTVQTGDTLGSIATRTGAGLGQLATVNCIADVNTVSSGQTLYVPFVPAAPSTGTVTDIPPQVTPDPSIDEPIEGTFSQLLYLLDCTTDRIVVTNTGSGRFFGNVDYRYSIDGSPGEYGQRDGLNLAGGASKTVTALRSGGWFIVVQTGQRIDYNCAPPTQQVSGEPQWSFTAYCTGTEANLRVELIGGTPPGSVPVTYYLNGAPWGSGSPSWDFPSVGAAHTFGPVEASTDTWGLLFNPTGEYQEISCPLASAP